MMHGSLPFTPLDVAEILGHIPTRPAYPEWIKVIAAVGSVLDPSDASSVLSDWSPEERDGEYLQKLRHRCTSIGIGTLIQIAKTNGFDASSFAKRRISRSGVRTPMASTSAAARTASMAPIRIKRLLRYNRREGTPEELAALARLRKLPGTSGLEAMQAAGCLAFTDSLTDSLPDGTWHPVKAWLVFDPTYRNISARRLDGKRWHCIGGEKSRCLSGQGSKSWPVGIKLVGSAGRLDVVEGEGDLISMWHLHTEHPQDAFPVGLLGACSSIERHAREIRPYIAGKLVQIYPHVDATGAGQQAAQKWAHAFYRLGAREVRIRDLRPWLGPQGKDLNDALAFSSKAPSQATTHTVNSPRRSRHESRTH